ncbi:MAG: hypothetical protein RMI74_08220 [Thermodesulfobacterium sp.]|nr:hypothetical protein [Thermodesulfobacterium sp.]
MFKLIILIIVLLLSQDIKFSKAMEILPLETCDKIATEIAGLQEALIKVLPEDRELIDLSNATYEEIERIKYLIFTLTEKKKVFLPSCYKNYALPLEELEKAPPHKFYFIIGETFYTKPGLLGIGRDYTFFSFPNLFFYLKKYTNLDLRFIVYPAYNYEQYNKKLQKFRKKMFFGEDLKANFCMKVGDNLVLVKEKISKKKSITITCPSFRLEKEHSLPEKNFLLKFPEKEIFSEDIEGKSVFTLLFTGKYSYHHTKNTIKYNNQTLPLMNSAHGLVLPLEISDNPEELITWLKRELSLRNLWSEKK